MNDLKEIVNEIESISKEYNKSGSREVRKSYKEYIELIILDAPKSEQYNLCNYWERLRG